MKNINKIDYFVGVFVTTILNSAKSVPALFEEAEDSKRVEFLTDNGDFVVFVKYSKTEINSKQNNKGVRKEKSYWNVPFSDNELDKINQINKEGARLLIAIVCTNNSLTKTWIAVMDSEIALKCLKEKTKNGSRRITVTRIGSAQQFLLKGVGFRKNMYESCPFDCLTYFEKNDSL